MRPEAFVEPRPQERVQRHVVEHITDLVRVALMVQILNAPVPQTVEQLPDVLRLFDTLMPDPEQVVEVPKILLEDVPMRTAVRDTRLAEQLAEVPTIVVQRTMEQHVDIPVPGVGGRLAGLQGFPPEQSSTATHSSEERISERIVEQIVEFPVSGGGRQDFRPGQSSSSSSHLPAGVPEDADVLGEGFFRQNKKVWRPHTPGVRGCTPVSAHPRRLLSSVFVSGIGS